MAPTKKKRKLSRQKPGKKKAPARKTKAKARPKAKAKAGPKTKARPKAAATRKPAARAKPTAPKKPRVRRDATGHLDPSYEADLRRRSRENVEHDDDRAFLIGQRRNDALADELGREFIESATSGEEAGVEARDRPLIEEVGGPFVSSTAGQEFDDEPDASNPPGSDREPFPKT